MLTKQDFIHETYREHSAGLNEGWANYLLQKQFWNGNAKTQYFINVYESKFDQGFQFPAKVQMYRGKLVFDITITGYETIGELEHTVAQFFHNLCMDLDPHN